MVNAMVPHPVVELPMTQPSSQFFGLLWKVANHFSGMSSTEIACQLDCTIRVASIAPKVVPWSSVGMQSMSLGGVCWDIQRILELSVEHSVEHSVWFGGYRCLEPNGVEYESVQSQPWPGEIH